MGWSLESPPHKNDPFKILASCSSYEDVVGELKKLTPLGVVSSVAWYLFFAE